MNDFTAEHYHTLLTKLSVNESEELFNDKKGGIRKALIKYFAMSHQIIDLDITYTKFTIRKHWFDPMRSETFDRIVHQNTSAILDLLPQKDTYLVMPYLISIPHEIHSKLFATFLDANETRETARNITRKQFSMIFGLDERDMVLFLRGKISIRYFTQPKKLPEGADKRFAGETIEEMEAMYQNYFPDGAWEQIEPILNDVIIDRLDFSLIDNATFSKNFIPVFRAMIEILLVDIVNDDERAKIEGFSGYVLRQNFHPILLHTAKNLLEFIEKRDRNAENFIKYYVDEIVIDPSGNKIKKHPIIDSKGKIWNYSSILSVMMQMKQAKVRTAKQEENIKTAEEKVEECEIDLENEKNNRRLLMDDIASMESIIAENDTRVLMLKGSKGLKSAEERSNASEISRLNNTQNDLLNQKKNKTSQLEILQNRISNKQNELAVRQTKLSHEQKNLQNILEQTNPIFEMYETIAEALSLVLSKR